jgi:hypothetical protein
MSEGMRVGLRLKRSAMVVAAGMVTLLATACSGAAPAAPAPTVPGPAQVVELTYTGGAVQGGVSRTSVQLGRQVHLVVHSDVADEIHVHGYDLKAQVPDHGVGTVDFVADQSGVFEVELESRGAQLAQLEVR